MTRTFVADDLETIAAVCREQYASSRLSSGGERHVLRIQQDDLGDQLRFDRVLFDMTMGFDTAPLGRIYVARFRRGRASFTIGRGEYRLSRGDVLCITATDEFQAEIDHADVDWTVLDPAVLDDVAETAETPRAADGVHIVGHQPVSSQAAAAWATTVRLVQDLSGTSPPPLLANQLARLLAVVSLSTFATNAVVDLTAGDRRDADTDTLSRAVAYIEANPDLDLTLRDIARASRVSPRTVQLAFRRHLDTTPTRYLRRVRLHHAHDELLTADPDLHTVRTIARRWGYAQPHRFADDYRAAYGVSPRQTLHGS